MISVFRNRDQGNGDNRPVAPSNVERQQIKEEANRVNAHIDSLHDEIDALTAERNRLGVELAEAQRHNEQLEHDLAKAVHERDQFQERWLRVDENLQGIGQAVLRACNLTPHRPPPIDPTRLMEEMKAGPRPATPAIPSFLQQGPAGSQPGEFDYHGGEVEPRKP